MSCPIIFHNGMWVFNLGETSYANKHSQEECTKQDAKAMEQSKDASRFQWPQQPAERQPLRGAEGQGLVTKDCEAGPDLAQELTLPPGQELPSAASPAHTH